MPSDSRPSGALYVIPAIAPFVATALVPWVVFTIIPYREQVTYDFPWAQLAAVIVVPFLAVGLCTAAAFLTGPATASMKHVFLAFASGTIGVVTLWTSTQMLISVRLDVITFLWSALLSVWVVALLRSLLQRRANTTSHVRHQDEMHV